MIAIATVTAAGMGYWAGIHNNNNNNNKIVQQQQEQPPHVPIPSIPSHDTILKAFQDLQEILPQEHVT
ncbi:hypothetical protein ABG067_009414, partial [Albugo candida]